MSKVPPILLAKIAALRWRERFLRLTWGAARVAALVLLALLAACAIDWFMDLWDDTPFALRVGLLLGQMALAALLLVLLLLLPILVRLRDDALALLVEEKRPELQHRLISALQLNRPGARTAGMSPELLAAMTRQATEQVAPMSFAALADHRRLKRALLVLCPALLLFGGWLALCPDTALALLQRQLLWDVEIPRAVHIESDTAAIWPSGEEVVLRFKATGPDLGPDCSGTVRIRPDGQESFSVPLTFEAYAGDTAYYTARLRPASVDFHYTARLGDGRMRQPSRVRYVPRPSVSAQEAYVQLPGYLGLQPDGTTYEERHPTGDVGGMPELSVRIVAKTQKPVLRAILQTYGSPYPDLAGETGLSKTHQARALVVSTLSGLAMSALPPGPLGGLGALAAGQGTVPLRTLQRRFRRTTQDLEWWFDLRPTETSYSIVVFDEYGFQSRTMTVRTLRIEPEPPPTIVLHPELFPIREGFSKGQAKTVLVEGLPLPLLGKHRPGNLPIAYEAFGPYGIGKVQLKIGVLRGNNSSGDRLRRGTLELWGRLELEEYAGSARRPRAFDLSTGAFKDSSAQEQIYFFAVPLPRPAAPGQWPRMLGGGRFDYKVAGFVDIRTGEPFEFEVGDRVVFYLEVFNRNPDPKKALMAKSQQTREKDVASMEEFFRVCNDTLQEASRIESLMYMQQQVYDRPWLSIFGFK